ncbi:MAG: heat-inducible transcriptional repressor HrcA [Candidatus Muproteobacteria bacterium RBG_16_65_34]|uniref:Heat-inducible transcription repressor HrcA n=1 Tax=Candidatus Muproteobacteria bacterium RBG_16_65_34 TaxID=1817760 RepID=A0A1F6TKP6_9PROT|nr:MAG: heat-inducible transcriptional repressor HrcA [Candidatus Muproteobacteria bacterium RBG_16_65_34]
MPLSVRAEQLLKTLVERYIADGQPVGSRTLARACGMDLSPATIRNIMADLEEMGLVVSPHTSAGRMPTQRGYRVFVDTLLKVQPLASGEVRKLREELCSTQDPQGLIECASQLLSEVSRLTGIVMLPRRDEQGTFRQIEFIVLSGRRILVITVTEDGQVHNRIITTERDYTAAELTEAANYFNETYSGIGLSEVKRVLLREMQQASDDMQRIMRLAVTMARQAFGPDREGGDGFVVRGESNLMDIPDLGDIRTLRPLFDAFNTKRDLLHLLERSLRTSGVKIFIGAESGYEVLKEYSVVTAPYSIDGHLVGTLGVIGPTRMSYEHVIPIVDITARLLSSALSSGERPDRLESAGL